ncbi:RING-H2 finger protein ATL18 [Tripterygium wilfordii]|uniref:RING-H2 finger protein ATL18 n=1 Tax=Tripterygium wilfordii TaxID=458696 RepID=UPI0018F8649F|nr:RING-H2 finger protein ATL18 [Tripterygium wilfordii]
MVFVVYPQRSLSVAIIVFYTCVWIPFQQMRRALLSIIIAITYSSSTYNTSSSTNTIAHDHIHPGVVVDSFSLPVAARFEDLRGSLQLLNNEDEDDIIICSICLVGLDQDQEDDDDLELVIKLPECNHIFHRECIHKWVDRDRFTCPLCRSFLFCPKQQQNPNTNKFQVRRINKFSSRPSI